MTVTPALTLPERGSTYDATCYLGDGGENGCNTTIQVDVMTEIKQDLSFLFLLLQPSVWVHLSPIVDEKQCKYQPYENLSAKSFE